MHTHTPVQQNLGIVGIDDTIIVGVCCHDHYIHTHMYLKSASVKTGRVFGVLFAARVATRTRRRSSVSRRMEDRVTNVGVARRFLALDLS